jgi:flagellin-like hook-associated protein FlgL
MRSNLLSMQNTSSLLDRTQERLSTGKKVNSALDDPVAYFAAKGHTDRASDLTVRKDGMTEAIQAIKAADSGIEAITDLLNQAKSLITSARTSSGATETTDLQDQYDAIMSQIDDIVTDSTYKGTNLLDSDNLVVEFNEDGSSSLTVTGFDGSSTGLAITAADFSDDAAMDSAGAEIDAALNTLRTNAQTLSANLAVVNARLEFTTNMVNTLEEGADNLTLADMNEEGANMLMLQTRMSLGTTSLSLASQAAQSVLRLF